MPAFRSMDGRGVAVSRGFSATIRATSLLPDRSHRAAAPRGRGRVPGREVEELDVKGLLAAEIAGEFGDESFLPALEGLSGADDGRLRGAARDAIASIKARRRVR